MSETSAWLQATSDHCLLRLRIQPGAKRTSVIGTLGDQLKVAVQAPPVDGKANEALLRWLAKLLGVRNAQISLVSGQTSRDKRVRVDGVEADQIRAALGAALGTAAGN